MGGVIVPLSTPLLIYFPLRRRLFIVWVLLYSSGYTCRGDLYTLSGMFALKLLFYHKPAGNVIVSFDVLLYIYTRRYIVGRKIVVCITRQKSHYVIERGSFNLPLPQEYTERSFVYSNMTITVSLHVSSFS